MDKREVSEKFLVIGTHRMGDAVMSLPALQMFREAHPEAEITLLGTPNLGEFWSMCLSIDQFQGLESFFPMIGKIKSRAFDRAYILPTSFGSALIPFLAGIPRRVGARGHWRRMMLTEIVHLGTGHQQFEAMSVFGVQGTPKRPALQVPEKSLRTLERKLSHFPSIEKCLISFFQALETDRPAGARPVITLLPGTRRSNGWSPENFSLLAKNLCSSLKAVVLLGGDSEDRAVCKEIEAEGYDIINLSGKTPFSEWAAMLQMSDCVVSHDNGGMHLASAVGTPVVGLYGLAEAEKTGPLGKHIVFQKKEVIGADKVYGAIKKLLSRPCS